MIAQMLKSRSIRWALLGVIIGVIEVQWAIVTDNLTPYIGAQAMGWVTIVFGIGAGVYRLMTTQSVGDK